MMSLVAPLGAKKPKILPWDAPFVSASNPAPAAPSWKHPDLFRSMTDCRACCQPCVPAKVVLPAARSAFQFSFGPYTVDEAIIIERIPGFCGTPPARPKMDLP